ncbi:glycosyltransferase family 9 protein [Halanaerobium sp. MA284_MarDTE_T2]|uniref:glycosyltransferase family 9 protein n=1 Tax=Halanaerobium sp. MA284_MarDTE_T2 TaxID=2183913 RepID=UPI000DF3FA94|nr:glycosyltransferase family 9 protein [Halanaerobium sp. MA284_MarDTE_T2]RCW45014.1 heptosyltransferase-2/heptosyltransferase-3 [Halanaerobium sp. MA284_MarDTE_T2]
MHDINRIIVVDLLYLGDLIFAYPFFEELRKNYPEARIDLVANSKFAEIVRENDNIDHVYSFNKEWPAARSFSFVRKLKKNNYHLGLNIHGNWRTALLLKLIAPDYSAGYGGKGRGVFLDKELKTADNKHMTEVYLDFLKDIGCNISGQEIVPVINFADKTDQIEKNLYSKLKEKNLSFGKDYIVLNTGGSWPTKQWPEEYFAQLADMIISAGRDVLFVGGPGDVERVKKIIDLMKFKADNICGQTSLLELAFVLKKSQLLISGDTGPVHVAAAAGTDTITIFGPSDEVKYQPKGTGKHCIITNNKLKCRPCGEHQCPLEHHKCMVDISPEIIFNELKNRGMIK